MMLLERRAVSITLSLVLLGACGGVLGQRPVRPSQKDKVVQPDDGPPPDQAVQPDPMAPPPAASQTAPEPEPEPEPEPAPAPESAPEPKAETPPPAPPVQAPVATPVAAPVQKEPVVPAPPVALSSDPKQRLLQTQTAALLELAQQLKTEIERAGTNTLSLVAVRKAEEIQKLSKNLKQAMQEQGQVTAGK